MEMCPPGFGVVPDIGDFDIDLSTMDTFDDLNIDIDNFSMVEAGGDPFGDFSLEQSLNLVNELHNVNEISSDDFKSSCILDDFDLKQPIKQDCMWSSNVQKNAKSPQSVQIKKNHSMPHHPGVLSLTPPSSYINQHLRSFHTPLPSSDEDDSSTNSSDCEIDTDCSRIHEISSSSGDHSYTSDNPSTDCGKAMAGMLLTPPDSSEDEDTGTNTSFNCSQIQYQQKNGLKEVENDRFNKVVRSILLKNSHKSKPKPNAEKAKFKISFRMPSDNSSVFKIKSKQEKKGTISYNSTSRHITKSYQNIKENKQRLIKIGFNDKQQLEERHRPNLDSRLSAGQEGRDKTSHREARDVHNQMERQRRTDLKNAYETLKDFVPTIANSDRASKQMILDKAIEHCKTLKKKEATTRGDKQNLVQKNETLRKKLALLQSQQTSCQLENASWEIQGW